MTHPEIRKLFRMKTKVIPWGSKGAFWALWDLAGNQPNEIIITAEDLASAAGFKDSRTASKHIDALKSRGLIHEVEHDTRTGRRRATPA